MAQSVKVFRVVGYMHLYRIGERRKFTVEVVAVKPEHAIERVLSELGSRHKLKRKHIKIVKVEEMRREEVSRARAAELLELERLVVS